MNLKSRVTVLTVLLAGAAVFWGCSQSPLAPTSELIEHPTFVQTTVPNSAQVPASSLLGSLLRTVTGVVNGLVGGVLDNGSWRVEIPKGAYKGTGIIRVQVDSTSAAICDLSIEPATLNAFQKPVTLAYHFASVSDAQRAEIAWWDPTAKSWRIITASRDVNHKVVTAQLWHFSKYSVIFPGKAGW